MDAYDKDMMPPPPKDEMQEDEFPPKPIDDFGNEVDLPDQDFQEENSLGGYGKPTKSRYNSTEGGSLMYGVYGQGDEKKGYKSSKMDRCVPRTMIVEVTSLQDMTSDEVILLEVGSYDFFEDPVSEELAIKFGVGLSASATLLYLF